jgi:aspartate/methionine/tyrosine aminotransferase
VRTSTPRVRGSPSSGDDELAAIAHLCVEHDLLVVTDEVCEHLVFEGVHRPIAVGLGLGDDYCRAFADDLRSKRDLLVAGLTEAGFAAFSPAGTYFVTADVRPLGESDGMAFCQILPERCGVVAVPNAAFYDDTEAGRSLVRFTFCKRREVLDEAVTRLKALAR